MSSEYWKLKQPPALSAILTLTSPKSKKPKVIPLKIVELTYSGLIGECPKDAVHQGEDIRLQVVVTPAQNNAAEKVTLENLEMSAKVGRLTLGASQEGDIVELQFVDWDRKRWDELKSARSSLQVQVERIFSALKC